VQGRPRPRAGRTSRWRRGRRRGGRDHQGCAKTNWEGGGLDQDLCGWVQTQTLAPYSVAGANSPLLFFVSARRLPHPFRFRCPLTPPRLAGFPGLYLRGDRSCRADRKGTGSEGESPALSRDASRNEADSVMIVPSRLGRRPRYSRLNHQGLRSGWGIDDRAWARLASPTPDSPVLSVLTPFEFLAAVTTPTAPPSSS
jgi:hypothetical protein